MEDQEGRRKKAEYQKRWYEKNKGRHIAAVSARNERVRKGVEILLFEHLSSHPCVDCGERDPVVLEFDHVHGEKAYDVGLLLSRRYPWATVQAEISKCEVRCANCHRRKTARDYGSWKLYPPASVAQR